MVRVVAVPAARLLMLFLLGAAFAPTSAKMVVNFKVLNDTGLVPFITQLL